MILYTYRCRDCGATRDISDNPNGVFPCSGCEDGIMRRVFSFNVQPAMQEHFNPSVGTVVSSKRQHADLLKRQSEAATIRTGIPHNYVPVDPADSRAVFGVTDEGLDATRAREVEDGKRDVQRYFPAPKPSVPAWLLPSPSSTDTL